jgi:thymidylate synthase (FAD)
MKIVEQSFEIYLFDPKQIMMDIESAARTCYKSEDKITEGSAEKLVKRLIDNDHTPMLEFGDIRVKFITDRGVTHELVRHRICNYAMESTRYCNYANDKFGNEITFIKPVFWDEDNKLYRQWLNTMSNIEKVYLDMIKEGAKAQEARSVLPNSLKTEIVVKANIAEWLHIFYRRTAPAAHPQMRALMIPLKEQFVKLLPIIFS